MYRRTRPVIMDDEMMKRKIISDIKNNGEDWIRNITGVTHMTKDKISDYLNTLIEEKRLFAMAVYTGKIGKPPIYYTTTLETYKEHEKEIIKKGYVVKRL